MWSAIGAARLIDEAGCAADAIEVGLIAPEPALLLRPRLYESDVGHLKCSLREIFDAIGIRFVQVYRHRSRGRDAGALAISLGKGGGGSRDRRREGGLNWSGSRRCTATDYPTGASQSGRLLPAEVDCARDRCRWCLGFSQGAHREQDRRLDWRRSSQQSHFANTGERDSLGRLFVDRDLRVTGVANIFAAGGVSRAATDNDGHFTMMSCQHALTLGKYAGYTTSPLTYSDRQRFLTFNLNT
jgi:hypothetical protein